MKFIYIDSTGCLNKIFFNSLFLKNFFNINLIYQFFIYYNSFYRINTSVQKNRSFVNFSTKKLYKQKGTGKARVGSSSSCIRIKGSVAFPNPFYLNYKKFFNKNSYNFCYMILYSNIFINNFFFIIEDFFFVEVKTKILNYFFYDFKDDKVFFLTFKIEKNFFLSFLNSKKIFLFYFLNFNPVILLKYSKLFITRSCLEYFLNVKFL